MVAHLRPALALLLLLSAVTGLAYPLLVTGIAKLVLPRQAAGSLIEVDGKVVGSALIGQNFTADKYFWGRPSATTDVDPQDTTKSVAAPYNAANSSGSNYGPTSKALLERIATDAQRLQAGGPVPVGLATASASGLDPDIAPADALYQVNRVAKARGLPVDAVRALVERQTAGRDFGLLGEPRVNVLRLNLALDALRQ